MTLVKHELKQGKILFMIWTAAIGFLLVICVFLFPEMKGQMESVNDVFASMGSFTEAFGMDRLNFGSLVGFYAVECGNVLGLGGAFYAALCAAGILSKEEKDKTAEFLLTHPVSRKRIITEKLVAVLLQITAMNIIIYAVAVGSIAAVGEEIPLKEISLLHLAYYLLQIELAGICFGISAFLRKGSAGAGLGIAAMMYFLNLIANIADVAELLKYITPFGYCDGADIVTNGRLDGGMVAIGAGIGIGGIMIAYLKYTKKDIH
ncbi:ABC transporter permease [Dorea acetigenes]|uniref:ABC transporter permease n=1 Tax=Dorea acetigenes TaxID=2981787 RepID=A0ABT2RIC6_9FIRM|nr:ABC transporter permease subunit [Dorea acetigenes]MCB6414378.1 ABC transporter permease [Faecalimonas umbilicata]MCU6685165.1 ABC transporter permease [Dorea acetigenes]SCI39037.1 ABC-type transport system involved in multi-copper enzyme maturation%2C permease component [uncultured Clostridium sp.]